MSRGAVSHSDLCVVVLTTRGSNCYRAIAIRCFGVDCSRHNVVPLMPRRRENRHPLRSRYIMRFIASVFISKIIMKKNCEATGRQSSHTPASHKHTSFPFTRVRFHELWPMRPPTGVRLNTGQEATSKAVHLQTPAAMWRSSNVPLGFKLAHRFRVHLFFHTSPK